MLTNLYQLILSTLSCFYEVDMRHCKCYNYEYRHKTISSQLQRMWSTSIFCQCPDHAKGKTNLSIGRDVDDVIVNGRQILFTDSFEFGTNESLPMHRDEQVEGFRIAVLLARGCHEEVVAHNLELLGPNVNNVRVNLKVLNNQKMLANIINSVMAQFHNLDPRPG